MEILALINQRPWKGDSMIEFPIYIFYSVGYISIDAMKKFLGELHDFIPGSSGYLAYHVQNEINMSAIKNKLKNKY